MKTYAITEGQINLLVEKIDKKIHDKIDGKSYVIGSEVSQSVKDTIRFFLNKQK